MYSTRSGETPPLAMTKTDDHNPIRRKGIFHIRSTFQSMKASWRDVLYYLAAMVLFLCVCVQVQHQVSKYLVKDKTVVTKLEEDLNLMFPIVSFCPGFRRELVRNTSWLMTKWNPLDNLDPTSVAEFPSNKTDMDQFWESVNFRLGDILKHIKIIDFNSDEDAFVSEGLEQQLRSESHRMVVGALNTTDGRCYSVRVTKALDRSSYLKMEFDLSAGGNDGPDFVPVYLHHRGNFLGLNANYWIQPPTVHLVLPGRKKRLTMNKDVFERISPDESAKMPPGEVLEELPFFCCAHHFAVNLMHDDAVLQEIRDRKPELCSEAKLCSAPFFQSILNGTGRDLPPCSSFSAWACMNYLSVLVLDRTKDRGGGDCSRRRKQIVQYLTDEIVEAGTILENPKSSIMQIAYQRLAKQVRREYILLDLGALVGGIGGSLGIFIGISFLDAIDVLIKSINLLFQKYK